MIYSKSFFSTLNLFAVLISAFFSHIGSSAESISETIDTIVFGSCLHQDKPRNILEIMSRKNPQVALLIGDNVYSDTTDLNKMREVYHDLKNSDDFQSLKSSADQLLGTWDDHDFGLNDSGSENPIKNGAKEIFWELFDVPYSHKLQNQKGVYSSHIFGSEGTRLQIIILDTRYNRSPLKKLNGNKLHYIPDRNPNATFLGPDQWYWLEGELQKPAKIRLIASSIQILNETHQSDRWAAFPLEKAKLLKLLKDTSSGRIILLSGDRHFHEISEAKYILNYPLIEFTSSGLNQGHDESSDKRNRQRTAVNVEKSNPLRTFINWNNGFGMIKINWHQKRIALELINQWGSSVHTKILKF